jgi:hypothetical protein
MPTTDHSLLKAALAGYLHHLDEINNRIAELLAGPGGPPKRTMSLAARRKIAAAQRKRWVALKGKKSEPKNSKRKMSAAARKRIGDAARKRWALLKAKKKGKPAK